MTHAGQLKTLPTIRGFIAGGRARLTLVSRKTGARFTYRVRKSQDGAVSFVGLMTGPDNERHFQYLGVIRGAVYSHGRTSKIGADAPGAMAFAWFHAQLRADRMSGDLEVWHEGRCARCGRALTVPESIERGFGPECAGIMEVAA